MSFIYVLLLTPDMQSMMMQVQVLVLRDVNPEHTLPDALADLPHIRNVAACVRPGLTPSVDSPLLCSMRTLQAALSSAQVRLFAYNQNSARWQPSAMI
jgi:hypothetical protein